MRHSLPGVRLFVSLCGRTDQAPESLLVVEPETGLITPIAVPAPHFGAFGLCITHSTVYSVLDLGRPIEDQPERSELLALEPETLRVRWRDPFEVGRDVHSLTAHRNSLYAISTGTDELLRLGLDAKGRMTSEHVDWRVDADGERADRHHLNTVAVVAGQLLAVAFGARPEPTGWRAARHGFVRSIASGDIVLASLYHPHSLCALGSRFLALR